MLFGLNVLLDIEQFIPPAGLTELDSDSADLIFDSLNWSRISAQNSKVLKVNRNILV